jgi:pSer/pThr/pTyr-binding forkhead associated (FHA) protein
VTVLRISGEPPVLLQTERVTIGRGPGNDVVLDDTTVADHHATLVRTEHGWLILDETKGDGVHIAGRAVSNHFLRPGEAFTLGDVVVLFDPPAAAETVPSSTPTVRGDSTASSTATLPAGGPARSGETIISRSRPTFTPPSLQPAATPLRTVPSGVSPLPPPPEHAALDPSPSPSPAVSGRTVTAADDDLDSSVGTAPTQYATPISEPARLEPEPFVRPSSKYLLGEEPAVGGGPVELTANRSGAAYSLGDANTLPGGAESGERFELGPDRGRPPSIYELGGDAAGVDGQREFSMSGEPSGRGPEPVRGSSASVYSMGADIGPRSPAPRMELGPAPSSRSVYSLGGDETGRGGPGASSPSVYSLDAGDRGGGGGRDGARPLVPMQPVGNGGRGPTPSPAESWSWAADPRSSPRTRTLPARGRGLVAVGFALLVLGGVLIGAAFILGLTGRQALQLLGGGA